jgi:hypothetical protein
MTRWILGIAAGVAVAIIACSNSDSSSPVCPDEETVGSGAACTTDAQKCSGSVDVGACPGQSANIAEYECTCTSGKWTCPQPAGPTCPADAGMDADAETIEGAADGAMTDAPLDAPEASTGGDAGDGGGDDAADAVGD